MQETKNTIKERDEIDEKYKWNLNSLYDDLASWEKDYQKSTLLSEEIQKYKGSLGKSSDILFSCLKFNDELSSITDKIYVYAKMKRDEDNNNTTYQALSDRAFSLATKVYASTSFIVPEIISIPEEKINDFMQNNESLKLYNIYISELLRQKKHILSEKEERILALTADISNSPKNIFTMYNNADIKFPFVKDTNGEEFELTKGNYIKYLQSSDRRVRKDCYNALYDTYGKQKNTLATTLISNIKCNNFYSTVRNYNSSLEASLDSDNIDIEVYNNLIDTVSNNLHLLHRYMKLRKKALKLNEMYIYDTYVPIVEEPESDIKYETALDMVKEGLKPLGSEYIEYLQKGFDSGWIDVFENKGKTSGAYSWGAYGVHPYVLLNYQGTINDVFTVAHEMGHALHSFYTNKTQPYIYSGYKIFVAEVASTVNESLLMHNMLNSTTDKKQKAYLLNHYLEEFRGTVFRQVMFAEFEKLIHTKLENGESLTTDSLCSIYKELNKKYFGDEVIIDDQISMEWARIPHFYNSFYVYKYATGFSAAVAISNQILNEGKTAVENYIKFLSSGSSDYPLELLKITGVDLSRPAPIQDALNVFEKVLYELETLI